MATGSNAYNSRVRRRKKQDQSDFDLAGYFDSPFDFGAALAGASSANTLTLPADIKIAFESSVALDAGDFGIENVSDAVTSRSADPAAIGAVVNMRPLYREQKQIRVARGAGSPAAAITIYFRGPKSQLSQVATATFT